ncbi:MAG: aromatic ring-hydroxylating dioxygenase subunit alpha [Bacteroidetes bacterium]|jgi:choline monooxygenase|nr:aromatic ring-hydroxylating dioxygenase subunit alpha [Bacteroidota bacterium]
MSDFFIDTNIAKAKTISTDYYTSEKYFEFSKEKIFANSWQLIGDTDKIKDASSAHPFILLENYLDEPLVLTKDKEGKISCLSNVCTHRGNLLAYKPCKLHSLVCKYHGRRFSLDGKFVSMPEFKEVENFPTKDDDLHSLSLFQWGKFLFTSLDPKIPADEIYGDIQKRLDWFPMDKLVLNEKLSKDYFVKANWALYCENYLEGFHIPFVHAGLNDVLDFGEYTTEVFRYSNLQIGIAKEGDSCFDLPQSSPDYGKNIAGYYFWAFPNVMLNFYPWGISVNYIQPISVNETKVSFLTYVSDESKLNTGAGSGLDAVEMEDEEVVENVQKGVRSRFYKHGRYSPKHEKGTHHFHSLIAEFIG